MNDQSNRSIISDVAFLIALCYFAHPSIAVLDKYWVGGLLTAFAAARGIVKIQKEGRQKLNDVVSTVVTGITGTSGNYPAVSQREPVTEKNPPNNPPTNPRESRPLIPRTDLPSDKRMKRVSFIDIHGDLAPSIMSFGLLILFVLLNLIFKTNVSLAAMPK